VSYFRISPAGRFFTDLTSWQPFNPLLGHVGPSGRSDTVKFDVGVPTASRYLVSGVAGVNDRLLVHNDSLTPNLSGNYQAAVSGMDVNPSSPAAAPEPASLLLLLTTALMMMPLRWRCG
jgi:hypothetical protein